MTSHLFQRFSFCCLSANNAAKPDTVIMKASLLSRDFRIIPSILSCLSSLHLFWEQCEPSFSLSPSLLIVIVFVYCSHFNRFIVQHVLQFHTYLTADECCQAAGCWRWSPTWTLSFSLAFLSVLGSRVSGDFQSTLSEPNSLTSTSEIFIFILFDLYLSRLKKKVWEPVLIGKHDRKDQRWGSWWQMEMKAVKSSFSINVHSNIYSYCKKTESKCNQSCKQAFQFLSHHSYTPFNKLMTSMTWHLGD